MTITNDNPFAVERASRAIAGPIFKTLILVSLCSLAAYGIHTFSRQWLIERLSFGLEEHPPHIQAERLSMLVEFGTAGLPMLVNAACSEHAGLSQNAYRTIVDMQGRWAAGSISDGPAMNLALVQAIAASAPTCPPQRRGLLANLLSQCIVECVDSTHRKDQMAYLESQQLLATLGPAINNNGNAAGGLPGRDRTAGLAGVNGRLGNQSLSLPKDPTDSVGDADPTDAANGRNSGAGESGSLLPPLPAQLLAVAATSETSQGAGVSGPAWVSPEKAVRTSDADPTAGAGLLASEFSEIERRGRDTSMDLIADNPLAAYDIRSVIDFLASPQPSLVRAAEAELRKRKMTEAELQLARRLVTEDPEVRLALVQELPSRTDVDPRTWLLWLSSDLERQVRLEAISVLGSMDDPAVQAALRDRLRDERDLVVASRIRRILGLR